MTLTLKRNRFCEQGIFGELLLNDNHFLFSGEHSYDNKPKLPAGTYRCVLGEHQLKSGPILTYEVTSVPGHSGILVHPGNNPQIDSEGCICVSLEIEGNTLVHSMDGFQSFMGLLKDQDTFTLVVQDE